MPIPFSLGLGCGVVLIDSFGRRNRHIVREIQQDGWMFEPEGREGERIYHSGEVIERHYLQGLMRYEPWSDAAIGERSRKRLRDDFRNQPDPRRRKALRKLRVVREVKALVAAGMGKMDSLGVAFENVRERHGEVWDREDTEPARAAFMLRAAQGRTRPGEVFSPPRLLLSACDRTIWEWVRRYAESGDSINALLDSDADKGRRESQLAPAQDEVIATYLRDHVKPGGFNRTAGIKAVNAILVGKGLCRVSKKAFELRLRREFDRKGLAEAEAGRRSARRVGSVSQGYLRPMWPMQQVESDHTLLNVRVVQPGTLIELGRPWLSVVKCRCTKMVAGMHLSLLPPSWATQSRATAHAMWPKDLRNAPTLKNGWGLSGVIDEMYTDRGMDYICEEGRWAAANMQFELLNFPGYMPWLKGDLERFNRTTKIEVLSYRDGVTSFKDREFNARNLPTMTMDEVRDGLLEWVVDRYNVASQDALMKLSPTEALDAELVRGGPLRPIPDFEKFSRLGMRHELRTIQNGGVEFKGVFYKADELPEIRRRHNGSRNFDVFFDPWNSGYAELRDGDDYVLLRNEYHELDGVSRYRLEYYWEAARRRKPDGARLTVDDFLRAKEEVDADQDRILALGGEGCRIGGQNLLGRFLDIGTFFTPVPVRRITFDQAPVEVPGFEECDGIYRPLGYAAPTGQSRPVIGSSTSAPLPAAACQNAATTVTAAGSSKPPSVAGSTKPPRGPSRFNELRAIALARSQELASPAGETR